MRDVCAEFGDSFDEWQDGAGRAILAKRADGMYAATVGGVVLSIPRQVAKTFLVSRIIVALCILYPGTTVLWTAHHGRTLTRTFRSLQSYVRRKKVAPCLAANGIRTANGEQEIKFRNDSIIMFGAREQGFGRGFEEVDFIVFDEAQILTEKALEDMVASTNQSRHPHGALLFFMGTPPRPSDPGEVFAFKRERALSGKAKDLIYVEFSADPGTDPDDRAQWERANPSFPAHTSLESMLRLRENLPSVEAWMREALGVWGARSTAGVIDQVSWRGLVDTASMAVDRLVLGVDLNPERSLGSVVLAGLRGDGMAHVELDVQLASTSWLVAHIEGLWKLNPICAVVIDSGSPASTFIQELTARKIRVVETTTREMGQACGALFDAVQGGEMRHIDQHQLTTAVHAGRKRPLGDAWAWSRKHSAADITPLVALTLALWGVRSPRVKRRVGGGSGRKAVVL